MRKLFVLVAATMAMVGCMRDNLMSGYGEHANNRAINVQVYVPNATRGEAFDSAAQLEASGLGFDLFAYSSEDQNAPFMGTVNDGVQFVYDEGTASWDYADKNEVAFWSEHEGFDISFYAVSPSTESTAAQNLGVVVDKNIGYNTQELTYIVPADCENQIDLMYASANYGAAENDNSADHVANGISLDFHHALSQIVFKAKTDSELVFADVQSVTINQIYAGGTFAMDTETWTIDNSTPATSFVSAVPETCSINTTIQQEVDPESGTPNDVEVTTSIPIVDGHTDGTLTTSTNALLLLPQNLEDNAATLTVSCRVFYGAADGTPIVHDGSSGYTTIDVPLTTDWQRGYKYIYTLIFSADMGSPIKVQSVAVDVWDEYNVNTPMNGDGEAIEDNSNPLLLNMNAADLFVGDEVSVEMATPAAALSAATRSGAVLSLLSADESIAEITAEGTIRGIAKGQTSVHVSCEGYDDAIVDINVLPAFKPVTLSTPIQTSSIQAGTYTMGLDYTTNAEYILDAMAHNVTINDNFHIGQYEVTVGQYVDFLNGNPEALEVLDQYEYEENGEILKNNVVVYSYSSDEESHHIPLCDLNINHIEGNSIGSLTVADEYKDLPIVCSWEGAAAFANSVGGYLPHEEEWEYAAKAGVSGKPIWWENDIVADGQFVYLESNTTYTSIEELKNAILAYENMEIEDLTNQDEPTYTFNLRNVGAGNKANSWGLYDLLGNVQEWCGNYDYDYELNIPDEVNHVVRGCVPTLMFSPNDNYVQLGEYLGVAFRNVNTGMNETGFRVAFKNDYAGSNQSVKQ